MLPGTAASGGCWFPKPPAQAGEPTPTGVTASCRRASAGSCGKGQGRGGLRCTPPAPSCPVPEGEGGSQPCAPQKWGNHPGEGSGVPAC